MRLNKHIGETGYCSRREADRLIAEKRVTINGQVVGTGAQVEPGDDVRVDGHELRVRAAKPGTRRHVYIALNKPPGITCTTETVRAAMIATARATRSRRNHVVRLSCQW